ncbi:MAG: DUF6265 family protein [Bryobacteraceae bacterium]
MTILLVLFVAAQIDQLSFMSGCWEGKLGGMSIEETWLKPAGGSLLGMARNIKGGKTVFTEHMEIREEAGAVVMHVQLRLAAKATPFKLTEITATRAVFSNPEHDFPQRIIYERKPDGSLDARVEGPRQGKTVGEDFHFRACATSH